MTAYANAFLLVYAGLFPILNPIGIAPVFLGLTSSCTEGERSALARRVAINSVLLLAGSMFIGSYLLVFFGITLPVVRIAGGLVLIAFGWKLLHSGVEFEDKRSIGATRHSTAIDAFYPLTMPLTVGPGSIAVAIGLGSQRPEGPVKLWQLALLGGLSSCGDRRAHVYRLCLLPLRRAYTRPIRRERCQRHNTLVRLHSPLYRHSGPLDRI